MSPQPGKGFNPSAWTPKQKLSADLVHHVLAALCHKLYDTETGDDNEAHEQNNAEIFHNIMPSLINSEL